jgi:phage N-6-adenine-methyltransferase
MFGPLVLDLFADDSNAKCPAWYTAEDNALVQDWSGRLSELGCAAFGNPPYSRSQYHEKQAITGMTHIMNYAVAQREKGGRYVFLLKATPSETWWPEDADHVCFIRGRIGFDLPSGLSLPTTNKRLPARLSLAPLLCSISPGAASVLVTSIELNSNQRAAHLWHWRSLPLGRRK